MEVYGYKYVHKLNQVDIFLESRRNWSMELIPKKVKKSDFLSILYRISPQEFRKTKFKIRDGVRIS